MSGKSMFYRFVTISRAAQARIATRQLEDQMPYVECFPECRARDLFVCTCRPVPTCQLCDSTQLVECDGILYPICVICSN